MKGTETPAREGAEPKTQEKRFHIAFPFLTSMHLL